MQHHISCKCTSLYEHGQKWSETTSELVLTFLTNQDSHQVKLLRSSTLKDA